MWWVDRLSELNRKITANLKWLMFARTCVRFWRSQADFRILARTEPIVVLIQDNSTHTIKLFFRFTSALLLYSGILLHSLPASLLFRPFSFYNRGQGHVKVKLSDLHENGVSKVKVTTENGHPVTSKNSLQKITNGVILTSDMGSQRTLEGKPGTMYSKVKQADESYLATSCDEFTTQEELHPLAPSDLDKQSAKFSDPNGLHDLDDSFMKTSKSVSALNDPKTRVVQNIKAMSHSNLNLKPWKGSGVALKNGHSLHMSTASLSIMPFQDLPPDVMCSSENVVRVRLYKSRFHWLLWINQLHAPSRQSKISCALELAMPHYIPVCLLLLINLWP